MQDFPAAHSMDTTWFAVDAEGQIGVFDSFEGGAVPIGNSQFHRSIYDLHQLFWEWSQDTADRTYAMRYVAG